MRSLLLAVGLAFLTTTFGCWRNGAANVDDSQNADQANESTAAQFETITDANVALAEGNRLLDENQTELAIQALKRAIKLNPDLAEAHFKLGIAYSLLELQMQQAGVVTETPANSKGAPAKTNSERAFERAVEAYKKWLTANPKDDVAQFDLGRTYAKLGQDEDAEKAFRQAVKLKPDDTEYQTELGAILVRLAKYHEAIEPLKKALELDDANARAQELLDDAEAGRQRLDYVSPKKDANQTIANRPANSNSVASTSANSNSNSSVSHPPTNVKPQPSDQKERKPVPAPTRPT